MIIINNIVHQHPTAIQHQHLKIAMNNIYQLMEVLLVPHAYIDLQIY